ncbi:facilitated trehalose transporter Tret1-like [Macrosteles quadrilineatus]|uniref:facilitated trehalose transporter Tret1-like n=1 Tax=Macrosteles quadrilineatus TaxID=74068 RepID=UPI0023E2637D|nr:facilitated trehalose transporter Tret1-like [Macrosteles quadrilineatus]
MATGGAKTQNGVVPGAKLKNGGVSISEKEKEHLKYAESKPVSQWRRALPQYLAAFAKNLLLLDLGMVIAFPTIVIPPLLHSKEGLKFTMSQASWFGSIVYFCQPLGSLTAAVTLDYLGRKRAMIFLNIPFFCCWVTLYYTQTVTMLFVLSGIMGLGIGSIEASILTYVGEISEPKLRGTLTSMAEIAEYMGFVFMFFLGTVTDWRTSALISALVPVVSCLSLLQIPETPIWLLSKGNSEEALKALCWLRGWVTPDQVQNEFDEMVRYSLASKVLTKMSKCDLEQQAYANEVDLADEKSPKTHTDTKSADGSTEVSVSCEQKKMDLKAQLNDLTIGMEKESIESLVEQKLPFRERLRDFCRQEMMMPMFLVCSFFFFTYGSGMLAIRPYMVPVFMNLGLIMDPYLATTVFTAIGLGGCVLCTVTVRFIGKRPLGLISVLGCAVSCLSLGTYALYVDELEGHKHAWMPMVMMVALAFFTGIGMDPLPWMYLSEVFPFRGRSMACGVAAGISYVFGFIATKTFLVLEKTLTLSGVFFLYGSFSVVGFIFFYFYLPETEGRTMQDIEESYKKKRKSDR